MSLVICDMYVASPPESFLVSTKSFSFSPLFLHTYNVKENVYLIMYNANVHGMELPQRRCEALNVCYRIFRLLAKSESWQSNSRDVLLTCPSQN